MHLSFPGARRKISFLGPVSRENFANALGQTCIHDLTLRPKLLVSNKFTNDPQKIVKGNIHSVFMTFLNLGILGGVSVSA